MLWTTQRQQALRGHVDDGIDTTHPTDSTAEAGDPGVRDLTDALHGPLRQLSR